VHNKSQQCKVAGFLFLLPAEVFHGINYCVAHLCFSNL